MGDTIVIDDSIITELGKIIQSLYNFAKGINFQWFNFSFSLWDIFIAGCVIGLLAVIWHGFID